MKARGRGFRPDADHVAQRMRDLRARKHRRQRRHHDAVDGKGQKHRRDHGVQERALGAVVVVEPPREQPEDHRRRHERPGQKHRLARQGDRANDGDHRGSRRYRKPPGRAAPQPRPRQHPPLQRADGQDRDRRIERQHIMRQLGQHQFENDPGRHQPRQQEFRAGLAPRPPDRRRSHARQRRARPERHPEQQQINARRCAVGFLRRELAQHVAADRVREERIAGAPEDRDEPGQHQNQHPHHAHSGRSRHSQAAERSRIASATIGEHDEHQDQRSLEQDAAGQCGPEDQRPRPRRTLGILAALPGQIDPRQRAHGRDHGRAAAWRRSWRAAPRRRAGPNSP